MNWTWHLRSRDGGMNGLEFARATTASGFSRVLVHAAPARLFVELLDAADAVLARGDTGSPTKATIGIFQYTAANNYKNVKYVTGVI